MILQNEVREGSTGKVLFERRLAGGGGALWLFRNGILGRGHSTDGRPEQRLPGTFQEPQRDVRRDEWVRGGVEDEGWDGLWGRTGGKEESQEAMALDPSEWCYARNLRP